MQAIKINEFLETFDKFTLNEKEYVLEILSRQISENNRKKIIKRVKESRSNLKNGKVKSGELKDLFQDLENE